MKQNDIRDKVISAIYMVKIYKSIDMSFEYKDVLANAFSCDYSNIPLFGQELFVKTLINENSSKTIIQENLSNWKFERLNLLIQAILLSSYTEREILSSADKKVIINEYVELAKKYGDASDYRLVNAVLDKVLN